MKYLLILAAIGLIPLVHAAESDSGQVTWKFCDNQQLLNYNIINGTLHDTAHLKLHGALDCEDGAKTPYQLQIFHWSNNQTDFTLEMPGELQDEIIDVRVVGKGYLENFQFNNNNKVLEFSDFTADQHGLVTIILDLK